MRANERIIGCCGGCVTLRHKFETCPRVKSKRFLEQQVLLAQDRGSSCRMVFADARHEYGPEAVDWSSLRAWLPPRGRPDG